jgi:hypothetical protein
MLTNVDEWCSYLLTFGLSTVLDLATSSHQETQNPFKFAAQQGLMKWTPPILGSSRRYFLKEAASRVYEDRIAQTFAALSTRDIQRQMSKQRYEDHMVELRHRRAAGTPISPTTFAQERPMSEWSTIIGDLTRARPETCTGHDIVSYVPRVRSALAQELTASITELSATTTPPSPSARSSSPRRTVAQCLLPTPPPSTVPSVRDRNSMAISMPSIEEHPAHQSDQKVPYVPSLADHPAFRHHNPPPQTHSAHYSPQSLCEYYSHSRNSSDHYQYSGELPVYQQHPVQHDIYASAPHEHTAEKAIYQIVDMGFTHEEAKEALRMTDLGDGLKVDRAVELLLGRWR